MSSKESTLSLNKKEDKINIECQNHQEEYIDMYCNQCHVPLCNKCITRLSNIRHPELSPSNHRISPEMSHIDHQISPISDIMKNKMRELTNMIMSSEDKLSKYNEVTESVKKSTDEFSIHIAKCVQDVKTRNSKLKQNIDTITEEFITTLSQMETNYHQNMKKTEKLLNEDSTKLRQLIEKCHELLKKPNTDMFQLVSDIKLKLDQFIPCEPPGPINPPMLITEDINQDNLKVIFGKLDKEERDEKHSIHTIPPDTDVRVISKFSAWSAKDIVTTVNENQAWMGSHGYDGLTMTTLDGHVIQTVDTDFGLFDLAMTKSDVKKLIVTTMYGGRVKMLAPDNQFIDIYVAPNHCKTQGLTVTDDNYIVVCLYNSTLKEGQLVKLRTNGTLIDTIHYDVDKQPLFEDPYRISSNRNGDLIVVQLYNSDIVVVNKLGQKRFTYTGHDDWGEGEFNPWYTTTDQYSHILISDYWNSLIHLLDKDGNFLQFIMTDQHGIQKPWGLSIDTLGRLWVCSSGNHQVMVVKYNQ